ncbi:putative membrane protein (DUF2078) [Desulfitobacterium dichloroeliminans LMG P-21439]|uniref:Putative membrane protein (DUF2078) n=2 Tax=Desulfitobacterium dichloroeliminans TaxID=233055 RepID=L0F8A0_DESDL|nr:SHOCT domain-containing protein [Desulfosporosinus sp.]AGA68886.1 putative membrane protein (DUF2078) [Desulfitobacterium dichloroeliminans LMG P-21439]
MVGAWVSPAGGAGNKKSSWRGAKVMFGGWGCSPFWGEGFWGIGLLGMSINLIFWILLVALIVYLFRKLGTGFRKPAFAGRDDALSILRERFARGEIDSEEYERRKQDLHR